ncbi:hypothetical protein BJY04DRAFT_200449 [Aspergillus karnatakaensis]|uniref:uncharacterized protein n=1 Tax=Aspergillus karnatakaensis TaxID=1810916 RepID=UPI003CCCD75E
MLGGLRIYKMRSAIVRGFLGWFFLYRVAFHIRSSTLKALDKLRLLLAPAGIEDVIESAHHEAGMLGRQQRRIRISVLYLFRWAREKNCQSKEEAVEK